VRGRHSDSQFGFFSKSFIFETGTHSPKNGFPGSVYSGGGRSGDRLDQVAFSCVWVRELPTL
jgi:hypothetical protein